MDHPVGGPGSPNPSATSASGGHDEAVAPPLARARSLPSIGLPGVPAAQQGSGFSLGGSLPPRSASLPTVLRLDLGTEDAIVRTVALEILDGYREDGLLDPHLIDAWRDRVLASALTRADAAMLLRDSVPPATPIERSLVGFLINTERANTLLGNEHMAGRVDDNTFDQVIEAFSQLYRDLVPREFTGRRPPDGSSADALAAANAAMGPHVPPLQLLRRVLHPILLPALREAAEGSLLADSEHLGDALHASAQQALREIVEAGMSLDAPLPSADQLATQALRRRLPRLDDLQAPFGAAMERLFEASGDRGEVGRYAMESLLSMRGAVIRSMHESAPRLPSADDLESLALAFGEAAFRFVEDNRGLGRGERLGRIAAVQNRLEDRLLAHLTTEGNALPDAQELRAGYDSA
jgi:hypothetical protein